ncbi:YcgL domain-containing protein [Thiomicrospira sp.]|uniref:YcgL domain-containing protein n=1 Tax=Thiomicrospira sp. TaxID=935 RepID=UPI002F959481
MQAMLVSAYKSAKKDELYLFVPQEDGLEKLPDELTVMFGKPLHVIDFNLTPDRKMGRENATEVLSGLKTRGYFIQMPPQNVEKISDMPAPPEHLDNIF